MLEKYNDVLKIEDVMEIMKIGRNAAYKLINDGTIKSMRIGRNIRIPKIYMMDFLGARHYNDQDNMICALASAGKGA